MEYSKKAQMQMSIGMIVTIVLMIAFLVVGIVFVNTIRRSTIENIDSIDQSIKNEINQLFAEDDKRGVIVYPPTREIFIKKGDEGGFGFSIRNLLEDDETFSYEVTAAEASCGLSLTKADDLIILGKTRSGINVKSGSILEDTVLISFKISEEIPLCSIAYNIDVEKSNGEGYKNTVSVILHIKAN